MQLYRHCKKEGVMVSKSPKKAKTRKPKSKLKSAKKQTLLTEKVISFFLQVSNQNFQSFQDFYEPNAVFQDPFLRIRGAKAIQSYYMAFFKSVTQVQLKFIEKIENEHECFLMWKMKFKLKWLPLIEPLVFEGVSYLRFSAQKGKVEFQRDHVDLIQLLLENIPLIGSLIQRLKNQFSDYISLKYRS